MNTNLEPWQVTALEHLPVYGDLVREATSHVDLWQCFKELVAMTVGNPAELELLRPIFDYAWWCINDSNNQDFVAAIETYFYEDLPIYSDTCWKFQHFIDQKQFTRLRSQFSARISDDEFQSLFVEYDT